MWRSSIASDATTPVERAVAEFSKPDSPIHAVLFYGVAGSGKRRYAEHLAKAWISGGDSESQAARSFDNGRNPDFLVVEPMGLSRLIKEGQLTTPKNPPANPDFKGIPVLDFIRTPPLVSEKKVVLILDADRMMSGSTNILLKSLEEPDAYFKFILTTTKVGSLPPTILSRCMAVACEVPPAGSTEPEWILAEGSPGRHADILEHQTIYRGIWELGLSLRNWGPQHALSASVRLKGLADALQKAKDSNARTANAEVVESLAVAVRSQHPDWPSARLAMVEAHRRIVGNGNATLVMDHLMADVLCQNGE